MKINDIEDISSTEKEHIKKMIPWAESALKHVLSLKENEKALVITDESKQAIGKAFEFGAKKLGARTYSYILEESQRPLTEIPKELILLFSGCNVVVNAFSANSEETPFRVKLVELQRSCGAKVGHAPGITEDMMLSGPMTVNYQEIAEKARHLIESFKSASKVHITTKEGTDLILNVKGRDFETDAWIKSGTMGNLPVGEIWCAPLENDAQGDIFVNGSIGDLGGVNKPLKIIVRNGKIATIESEDSNLVEKVNELTSFDNMASVIGELGIGLNPKARLTGNLLEDEKAGGTAHIAFGYNQNMPGGKNNSKTHRDFLFYNPTFEVEYEDGSKRIVIKDGKVVV